MHRLKKRVTIAEIGTRNDAKTAYQMVAEAAAPANVYYRSEWQFMQGWIALRFLDDVATARTHFARIGESTIDPLVQARGAYWRGRGAEAAGDRAAMRTEYAAAARFSTSERVMTSVFTIAATRSTSSARASGAPRIKSPATAAGMERLIGVSPEPVRRPCAE